LAVELLERLLEGEIKSRFAGNVVQNNKFFRIAGQRYQALSEPLDRNRGSLRID
jgi:hypothetical protein